MTHEQMVREFMVKHRQGHATHPDPYIGNDIKVLRLRLMMEELGELSAAIHQNDIVLIADGLADLDYVVTGTAIAFGLPHEAIFREVHRSNMTKPRLDANNKGGKVSKEGYEPPDLVAIIQDALS